MSTDTSSGVLNTDAPRGTVKVFLKEGSRGLGPIVSAKPAELTLNYGDNFSTVKPLLLVVPGQSKQVIISDNPDRTDWLFEAGAIIPKGTTIDLHMGKGADTITGQLQVEGELNLYVDNPDEFVDKIEKLKITGTGVINIRTKGENGKLEMTPHQGKGSLTYNLYQNSSSSPAFTTRELRGLNINLETKPLAPKATPAPLTEAQILAQADKLRQVQQEQLAKELIGVAKAGNTTKLKQLLLQGTNPDLRDAEGRTPLMHAIQAGHSEAVSFLYAQGAKLDTQDHQDRTPLIYAVEQGSLPIVQFVLSKGSKNINKADRQGHTALAKAILNPTPNPAIVRALLDKDADPAQANNSGDRDAVELAKTELLANPSSTAYPQIISMLGAEIAKRSVPVIPPKGEAGELQIIGLLDKLYEPIPLEGYTKTRRVIDTLAQNVNRYLAGSNTSSDEARKDKIEAVLSHIKTMSFEIKKAMNSDPKANDVTLQEVIRPMATLIEQVLAPKKS